MTSSLTDRRVLVAGGTGEVGEGIVRQLLRAGATVVVPARSESKLEALRNLHPSTRLEAFIADFSTVGQAQEAIRVATTGGSLDAAIASLGGWWQGQPLATVSQDTWDRVLAGNLSCHFAVARAVLPHLAERRGTYFVQLLGGAASFAIPHAGLVSITAAAVAMMGRVLEAESASTGPIIRQLQVNGTVSTRSRPHMPDSVATADEVGLEIVKILDGSTETLGIGPVVMAH